ncbi:hypothetical protein [Gelidibacter maritimus]|uniref:Uncharacterized protein n=1 Tax=Gelidibacter maritimus TaxID=2761487 RepID=A0A7W2R324_9FLAO|nr:hypothetical protein [Gelidibacter maritimus]MBA6152411.1 hypothetical protein [Gelidibacter maritimus]
MARQKGIFKITGTIGGINFYITKGVGYARKAGGGFDGHAIRTQASMQRVRENASEFGHSSSVKKAFRLALLPFMNEVQDKKFHSNLMQLFLQLKTLDMVSERGKRRVHQGLQTAKGRQILRQYDLTPKNKVLEALCKSTVFDWPSQTLKVSHFNLAGIKAPTSATHLGISLGILDFDFESLESSLVVSPTRFIDLDAEPISFELTPDVIRSSVHTGIVLMGVRYFEVISEEVYGLETLCGVRIINII